MSQSSKTKICLVGDALSGGGAERAHASLSNYFVSKGIEVHNVIVQDRVTYHFSGELLNMGKLKGKHNGIFDKLKRFSILRRYIKEHDFDYIIDFRMRRKLLQDVLISRIVYTVPTIYSVRSSFIDWYMPKQSWLTRYIYGKSYGIVAINKKMKAYIEQRHGLKNVVNIYNPANSEYIQARIREEDLNIEYNYILAVGRMDDVKQFDKLIKAYSDSVLPGNNIKLLLLGGGHKKNELKRYADNLNLSDKVVFMGFQENPYVYMKKALFVVLSSKFEGTPNVILESLVCGTPVVSFDCFTGPSEIINDKQNGLLIEDKNVEKLTEGINLMFTDKKLYNYCKQNATASIEKFSLETIGNQWLQYLKIDK